MGFAYGSPFTKTTESRKRRKRQLRQLQTTSWVPGNHGNHGHDENHGNPGCKPQVPQSTGLEISNLSFRPSRPSLPWKSLEFIHNIKVGQRTPNFCTTSRSSRHNFCTSFNNVQTRCIVKDEAQKSQLFWRFSGGFCFSQERLFSRNSTRKLLNLI